MRVYWAISQEIGMSGREWMVAEKLTPFALTTRVFRLLTMPSMSWSVEPHA